MLRLRLLLACAAFAVCGLAAQGQAAVLNISAFQLLGASGVDVNGRLYNVEFVDGTCIALYNGCGEVSDFDFDNAADALAAANALLSQVLIDNFQGFFSSDPSLVFGCTHDSGCRTYIPFGIATPRTGPPTNFERAAANNVGSGLGADFANTAGSTLMVEDTTLSSRNFARFTAVNVPEPATPALLGAGLVGLGFARRRG